MKAFQVTDEETAKIHEWLMTTVYPPIIEEQRKTFADAHEVMKYNWDLGYPYGGAIGGGVTYCFTPTSLGTVFIVQAWGQELNLTDYDSW